MTEALTGLFTAVAFQACIEIGIIFPFALTQTQTHKLNYQCHRSCEGALLTRGVNNLYVGTQSIRVIHAQNQVDAMIGMFQLDNFGVRCPSLKQSSVGLLPHEQAMSPMPANRGPYRPCLATQDIMFLGIWICPIQVAKVLPVV